jgi:hypothetical protein
MNRSTLTRFAAVAVGAAIGITALTLPSSGLSFGLGLGGGSTLLHVSDCRSVALARNVAHDIAFSSNTTGPQTIHVAAMVDGSLTLCYSLDVASLLSVNVAVNAAVSSVAGIINATDASTLCTAINLKVGPGVKGTVSASVHGTAIVDGTPQSIDEVFAKDIVIDKLGENIVLGACADTNGNTSVS